MVRASDTDRNFGFGEIGFHKSDEARERTTIDCRGTDTTVRLFSVLGILRLVGFPAVKIMETLDTSSRFEIIFILME